ncbi:hypothetical protein BVG16_26760 [Paenibacillus selenitireducens]|uniref:RCK N-terminal domain-containing protein n=1 Tax=Paenibacillus selenitireducens TaxID=1324314 RepID=A0A1T2X1H4_9BACL|nr:hypothetical protein [Paenibacillus selenitireducens]OPA73697.1 hypothetical protein BVG16_26760 [Paenibacillus selenitireducens]
MEKQEDYILVSAPNKMGEVFVRKLMAQQQAFAVIVNNKREGEEFKRIGVKHIILVDSSEQNTWKIPDLPIGSVYLFESSLNLCCRYIQICRTWTSKPIYVITRSNNPRLVYKSLGASYIIHTHSSDVSFLLEN